MKYFFTITILGLILILQSTVLGYVAVFKVTPDLAMIFLIFISTQFGSGFGQVTGFVAGLVEDILSLAPLGFNAFIKTLTGFLFGLGKGNVYYDPIFIPILMVFFGTLFKGIMVLLLSLIFNLGKDFSAVFNSSFIIELVYNAVAAPLMFLLFNVLKKRLNGPGRGFDA